MMAGARLGSPNLLGGRVVPSITDEVHLRQALKRRSTLSLIADPT